MYSEAPAKPAASGQLRSRYAPALTLTQATATYTVRTAAGQSKIANPDPPGTTFVAVPMKGRQC